MSSITPANTSAGTVVKQPTPAAALASLRAEVLLRLIETMLKHMPRAPEQGASRELLETLLAVLKSLPAQERENGRKLADIIAKLPPELRPAAEKLIGTVLSSLPTRTLVEIIRNPNGPEAQKLALFIASSLASSDDHSGGADAAPKPSPSAFNGQQFAIVDHRGNDLLRSVPARLLAEALRNPAGPEAQKLATLLSAELTADGVHLDDTPTSANSPASGTPQRATTSQPAIPARLLAEALRNPTGPEAQKLAALLMRLEAEPHDASSTAGTERKPLGLTAQQLAAVDKQGTLRTANTDGDARALQTALKGMFTLDGDAKPTVPARAADTTAARLEAANSGRPQTTTTTNPATATEQKDEPLPRLEGKAEVTDTADVRTELQPARAQNGNAIGQALARSVLQAVARDLPAAVLTQAVEQLVENLSPEEANFLRRLLEQPLEPATAQQSDMSEENLADDVARQSASEGGKVRSENSQPPVSSARPVVDADDVAPAQIRTATQPAALAEAVPERLVPAMVAREGVPVAFVPYRPAEEDLVWPEGRKDDEDMADEEIRDEQSDGDDAAPDEGRQDTSEDNEPETPEMARKREKTKEMVGVLEPGLVFYQKLGDYWT